MIWLRDQIERGRCHPVLGPVLLVLLAILLAFVAIHGVADQSQHDGYVCVGLMLLLVVVLLIPRPRLIVVHRLFASRGPPRERVPSAAPTPFPSITLTPLRL